MIPIDTLPETISAGHMRLTVAALYADCGVPEPALEADRLVCGVTGIERAALHAHPERPVGAANFHKLIELSIRRAAGEPLAYLLGGSYFFGRKFAVDRRVLIPRTETEILTQRASEIIKNSGAESGALADWCCGSGCIAISLLAENPGWRGYAADISTGALNVTELNARKFGVADRLTLVSCASPSEAAGAIPHRSLDILIANPPYIPTKEIDTLEAQVRDYEPRLALDGGDDGLDVLFLLAKEASRFMKPGAPMLFETAGPRQVAALKKMFAGAKHKETFSDHRGITRFAIFEAI